MVGVLHWCMGVFNCRRHAKCWWVVTFKSGHFYLCFYLRFYMQNVGGWFTFKSGRFYLRFYYS
jgi:hypothetical protein